MSDTTFAWVAFVAVMIGGLGVHCLVRLVRRTIKVPPIAADSDPAQLAWEELYMRRDTSGHWVGAVERIIFFGSLLLVPHDAPVAIAAWLAFKVAAKWEAWNHMGYVPDHIEDIPPLTLALARRIWAAQGYATLVVGTSANFLLAAAGVAFARYGRTWLC
jgi:hypothetical protein